MYDENIALKNKQAILEKKNEQLETKINELKRMLDNTKAATSS
jgi:peptidoglycan hydrolase CwlO-like protein